MLWSLGFIVIWTALGVWSFGYFNYNVQATALHPYSTLEYWVDMFLVILLGPTILSVQHICFESPHRWSFKRHVFEDVS